MTMNTSLERDDYDGRLKDLERRMHTLEDRHEDIIRAARADDESVRTLDGNPPPATSVSDREREAEAHRGTSIEEDLGMPPLKADKKK